MFYVTPETFCVLDLFFIQASLFLPKSCDFCLATIFCFRILAALQQCSLKHENNFVFGYRISQVFHYIYKIMKYVGVNFQEYLVDLMSYLGIILFQWLNFKYVSNKSYHVLDLPFRFHTHLLKRCSTDNE